MNQYKVTDSEGSTHEIEADFVDCSDYVSFIVESGKGTEIVAAFLNPISWQKVDALEEYIKSQLNTKEATSPFERTPSKEGL